MTRTEMINRVSEIAGISKTAAQNSVEALFGYGPGYESDGVISDALAAGEKISIQGFGSFETVTRSARTARDPWTGDKIEVPEKRVVKFKPGSTLTDRLNSGS